MIKRVEAATDIAHALNRFLTVLFVCFVLFCFVLRGDKLRTIKERRERKRTWGFNPMFQLRAQPRVNKLLLE